MRWKHRHYVSRIFIKVKNKGGIREWIINFPALLFIAQINDKLILSLSRFQINFWGLPGFLWVKFQLAAMK